jgi:hypothetical protein
MIAPEHKMVQPDLIQFSVQKTMLRLQLGEE